MKKYGILVATLAVSAAQAWDGKLIKCKLPKTGLVFGYMARYYDEHELSSTDKFDKSLDAEGFSYIETLPPVWSKYIDGVEYCFSNDLNNSRRTCRESEEEIYQSLKELMGADNADKGVFKNLIEIDAVCKEHNASVKTWYERFERVVKRAAQEHPGFTYEIIDYIDGKPASHESRWTRFVNFFSEKKLALGLGSLGILMLAASHYYSR